MSYELKQNETDKLTEHFGKRFYEKVSADIRIYSEKWNLEITELVDYYSINCIFKCRSEQYGDAVLKIGKPCKETFTEFNALYEYNGGRFCNVFNSDTANGIILEEQIKPGIRLREEKALTKRLSVFSELYNGLHIKPHYAQKYPSYLDWVNRITEYMSGMDEHKELYLYMKKAQNICSSLSEVYSKKLLLHGDLHHDNILLGENGEYKIIDPKGVVGDPIFDIPRFILNEFYDDDNISYDYYKEHVLKVISCFEKSLQVPSEVIKKCVFIETAMANCWNVESGEKPDMNSVAYSEAVM